MWRVLIAFVLFAMIPTGSALGHPPGEIELEFDLTEGELEIAAFHLVRDSSQHFVDRIVVKLKGDEIIEQIFSSQNDNRVQIVEYTIIDAKPGDQIEVIAGCNISGRKTGSLIVEEKVEQEAEQDPEETEDDQ